MIRPLPWLFTVSFELLQLVVREDRGINVAEDVDVVLARLQAFREVGRPGLLDVEGIDANGIDLNVARGVQ